MKTMKNRLLSLAALACVLVMLVGCRFQTSVSFTFSVDTGDSIKVSLDTTDKYSLTSDVPFTISHNGETVSQGAFIYGEAYAQYVSAANSDEKSQVLDSGTKDGNEYVFWCYDNKEYNYVIFVRGSNTGIVLGNTISEDSAKACFQRLSFSIGD